MEKDHRYKTVKVMIETGNISEFKQLFDLVPKSVVAHDLGTNNNRMTRMIAHVEQFTVDELYKICRLVDTDFKPFMNIVITQFLNSLNDKKNRKKS